MKDLVPYLTRHDNLTWCFPLWQHDHKHINKSHSVINNRCRIKSVDKFHQVFGPYVFSTTSKSHCSEKLPKQLFSEKLFSMKTLTFVSCFDWISRQIPLNWLWGKVCFTVPTTHHRIDPKWYYKIWNKFWVCGGRESQYNFTKRDNLKIILLAFHNVDMYQK